MVRTGLVMVLALWMLAFPLAGCGGPDLVIGGPGLPKTTVTPTASCTPIPNCGATNAGCNVHSDCCSCTCTLNACE